MGITFELYTGTKIGVTSPSKEPNTAYLKFSDWDDYGYKTLFALVVFDSKGGRHDIGSIKIGCKNQNLGRASALLNKRFKSLGEGFFSLGQDEMYYRAIHSLDPSLRENVLRSLRDIVFDEEIYRSILMEEVFKTSLLRDVSLTSIEGQFRRILHGGAIRTEFHFKYKIPQQRRVAGLTAEFHVVPDSNPPSNVHVLIGRNGVGKTHLLNNMVRALVANDKCENVGKFSIPLDKKRRPFTDSDVNQLFSGVVSVAFSAFDPFEPYSEKKDKSVGVRYSYIGLKRAINRGGGRGTPMSREMLSNEFTRSLLSIITKGKFSRWALAIKSLESDVIFRELSLTSSFSDYDENELKVYAKKTFNKMSSGHAIVLLTVTKLVEKVEEKTLVLIDEPESHLHPPLLSAFVRALSDLLSYRNGVAIVATHSPVVLQEVPRNCVYKISRSGLKATVQRPLIETFGENIGVLTREIFGLEVSESGYHKLLEQEIDKNLSYSKILKNFNGQLGSEAKGILRSLILAIKSEEKE